MGKSSNLPKKFDQEAKDRVVRLVEDRILAENISMQAACKIVAPKLGVSWHTARQWTQACSSRRTWVWNQCPRTLLQKTHGCRSEERRVGNECRLQRAERQGGQQRKR